MTAEATIGLMVDSPFPDFRALPLAIEILPASGPPEQLLLLLHGWAQEAQAMQPLALALQREFPQAAVLAPQAPLPADAGRPGRMWHSIEGLDAAPDVWPTRVGALVEPLREWVQAQQQRLGVGSAATCLCGFSQGAVLSLATVQRHDGLAGRVLAFGGAFTHLPELPPRHTTLHLFHGRDDRIFSAAALSDAFEHLGEARGDATIDIAEGVGHELHPVLIDRALFRLRNHIPLRTWQAAMGAAQPAGLPHNDD